MALIKQPPASKQMPCVFLTRLACTADVHAQQWGSHHSKSLAEGAAATCSHCRLVPLHFGRFLATNWIAPMPVRFLALLLALGAAHPTLGRGLFAAAGPAFPSPFPLFSQPKLTAEQVGCGGCLTVGRGRALRPLGAQFRSLQWPAPRSRASHVHLHAPLRPAPHVGAAGSSPSPPPPPPLRALFATGADPLYQVHEPLQAESFVGVYRLESPDDQHRVDGRQEGLGGSMLAQPPLQWRRPCIPCALLPRWAA